MSPQTETVEALCQLLETGDEADRCYAARALGVARDSSAVEPLIERLRDEDIDVCVDAADALGLIRDPAALPALIESLENDPSGEICTAITRALSLIGGTDALAAMRKIALQRPEGLEWDGDWDTWWDVQREAVLALGRAADNEAVDTLLQIIDDEQQQDIESDILRALAQIPERGVSSLIERLQDPQLPLQQRWRAARALGSAPADEQTTRALGRALQQPAPEIRAEAAGALAALGAGRYASALLLLLRDPHEQVRTATLQALIRLAQQEQQQPLPQELLLELLNDPSNQVRATLYKLLLPTVHSAPLAAATVERVIADLNNPAAETAGAACQLLAENGDLAAAPALQALLQQRDGHPMVRREAAHALGRFGQISEPLIELLEETVNDPDQSVRQAALVTLMQLQQHSGEQPQTAEGRTPLQVIIAVIMGEIETLPETAAETVEPPTPQQLRNQHAVDAELPAANEPEAVQEEPAETSPEVADDTAQAAAIDLPETAARIVTPGEVRSAGSTLEAIAMDSVETLIQTDAPASHELLDSETLEYLQVVEKNKELMRRFRSNRKVNAQQDVRRLGVRVLADCDLAEGIETLVATLSDDEAVVRREAAEAIGRIAERNAAHPALVDAVGTLITQLAVGDLDLRQTCARSLGLLGHRAAIVPLLEALQDAAPNVRILVSEALTRLASSGSDPTQADHMVVRDVPPLSIARRILKLLDDPEAGVRTAAAGHLAQILPRLNEQQFTEQVIERTLGSVAEWTGEEARLMGKILRAYPASVVMPKLLSRLQQAEDSLKRSIVIEMLEELLNPDQGEPDQAA